MLMQPPQRTNRPPVSWATRSMLPQTGQVNSIAITRLNLVLESFCTTSYAALANFRGLPGNIVAASGPWPALWAQ
jgi:hypothetical protein